MVSNELNTAIHSADKLNYYSELSKNRFIIPDFQRTYDWDEKQINELINDIQSGIFYKQKLYLGVLVFVAEEESTKLEIIDGQQRTITFLIILRVISESKNISQEYKNEIIELLEKIVMKQKHKLQLNIPDFDDFFKNYILEGKENISVDNRFSFVKRIKRAKDIIREEIDNINDINKFYEFIKYGIEVVFIKTTNTLTAYDIFESINSKKLDLALIDLTKNILLKKSKMDTDPNNDICSERISELIKLFHDSPKETSNFLKVFWASREKMPRNDFYEIYKESDYFKQTQSIELVNDFLQYAKIYIKIINPEEDKWNKNDNERKIYALLKEIQYLNFKTLYPLILQLIVKNGTSNKVASSISKITYLSFIKIVLLKDRPGILEEKYSKYARDLFLDKLTLDELYNKLKMELNNEFSKAKIKLAEPIFDTDNKQIKYLLYKIYKKNIGTNLNIININLSNIDKDSIEHILPQSLNDSWKQYIQTKVKFDNVMNLEDYRLKYCYKLGNLSLLSSIKNSDLENKDFEFKKKKYIQHEKNNSLFKDVIDKNEWSHTEINLRTKLLIDEIEDFINNS